MHFRTGLLLLRPLTVLTVIFLFSNISYANNEESIAHIQNVVKQFITREVELGPDETLEVKMNHADAHFQVPACSTDIEPTLAQKTALGQQVSTIELICNGSKPWRLYVPVDVQVYKKVLAVKHTIPAKESITESDIDYVIANKNRLYHGYYVKKDEVIGTVALHTIRAGSILTKKSLHLPVLVQRNQAISIIAKSNTITVTMAGVAKSDGSLNSLIKVFNPSSKRTIDAIVVGPNKAQVVN